MNYLHNNPPPVRIGVFLYPWWCKTALQVLYPHPRCYPSPIWKNVPHGPLNLLLDQDPTLHVDPIYQYGYGFPRRGYPPVEVCPVLCQYLKGYLRGGGMRLLAYWYRTFICAHASLGMGGSSDRRALIYPPATVANIHTNIILKLNQKYILTKKTPHFT